MGAAEPIHIVAIGCYRDVATSTNATFAGTAYRIAAVLDLYDSPKAYTYSKENLGAVLWAMNARPKVIITGAGISIAMAYEAMSLWNEYIEASGLKDGLAINLAKDPSRDGDWKATIMKKLEGQYSVEI